jgi:glycosyltransferase involved in cell wall biosynthesis
MSLPLRRVLFVSYVFPPTGGAGVQRVTKFIKYLPLHGWTTSVLTVANPSVPVLDDSLGGDIPGDTIIRRAQTFEPSYATKAAVSAGDTGTSRRTLKTVVANLARRAATGLLQPDVQVLWAPGAIREGKRLLSEIPHHAIVASGPPFSTLLIGASLSRASGLPLILDYRDEWGLSNQYWENRRVGRIAGFVQRWLQARTVRAASALVATTMSSASTLEKVRSDAGSRAGTRCIYNGYDREDFSSGEPPVLDPASPYHLVYVGTLWRLTDASPFVDAILEFARREPDLARQVEITFVGRRTPLQAEQLERLRGLPCELTCHPYLDHRDALKLIRGASGLLLLLAGVPGAERVMPAKVFEYMAAQKPILGLAPRGEMWSLLEGHDGARLFEPRDLSGFVAALEAEVERHRGGRPGVPGWTEPLRYSRAEQAGELAAILESVRVTP